MSGFDYNKGSYLVIRVNDLLNLFIAEVLTSHPLKVKVKESGPLSCLRQGQFMVLANETEQLQDDISNKENIFFKKHPHTRTGLQSLGVEDNKLHELTLF